MARPDGDQASVGDGDEPPRPRRRARRYLLVALGLVVVAIVLGGIKFAQIRTLIGFGRSAAIAGPPPERVGTAIAQRSAWEVTISAVGSVAGVRTVAIGNEVAGRVTELQFTSGDLVKQGAVLVRLDVEQERAELAAARARRANAALTARRSRELVARGAVARQQLDTDETALEVAGAEVAALEAQIAKKTIRAPFDGRLGIRQIDVGQYLPPGTPITTIDGVAGTYVDFTLPQARLADVAVGRTVRITVGGVATPIAGTITAIDPTVDPSTRSVGLRATPAGESDVLRPGMFVELEVVEPRPEQLVTIPATAIVHATYGDSVFVVHAKPAGTPGLDALPDGRPVKIARQQFVKVGPRRGDFVALDHGVRAGQEVVTEGAFKLHNGAPIVVANDVKPVPSLTPHPGNR